MRRNCLKKILFNRLVKQIRCRIWYANRVGQRLKLSMNYTKNRKSFRTNFCIMNINLVQISTKNPLMKLMNNPFLKSHILLAHSKKSRVIWNLWNNSTPIWNSRINLLSLSSNKDFSSILEEPTDFDNLYETSEETNDNSNDYSDFDRSNEAVAGKQSNRKQIFSDRFR